MSSDKSYLYLTCHRCGRTLSQRDDARFECPLQDAAGMVKLEPECLSGFFRHVTYRRLGAAYQDYLLRKGRNSGELPPWGNWDRESAA